jgi:outer membrane immunogenic protein
MKKLLLASTAILCSGAAMASDLPPRVSSKAAMAYAAAPAPFSWTGCYAGAHAGAGWSRTKYSDPTGIGLVSILPAGGEVGINSGAGFVGGGQLGCDYQFANNWVVGLAGDFSFTSINGQVDDPFFTGKGGNPATMRARTEELGSVTGRIGYAWDRYLVYGKGGIAWANNKYNLDNLGSSNGPFCGPILSFTGCNAAASDTHVGWTAGVGFEWAFAGPWSMLLEYDHYGFGNRTLTFADQDGHTFPLGVKQDIDVVKVGINYRFGGLLR